MGATSGLPGGGYGQQRSLAVAAASRYRRRSAMTRRASYVAGAAVIAVGGLVVASADPSGSRSAIAALAYGGLGALVLRWGTRAYGPAGGLGSLMLTALSVPVLVCAGAGKLAAPLLSLAAAYALSQCLLDPTLLRALASGVLIGAAALAGAASGQPLAEVAGGMALFSLLLGALRVVAAEPHEPRARTAQAAGVATAIAWAVAATIAGAALHVVPLAGAPARPPVPAWQAGMLLDALVMVVLAAGRPWRWHRRYSDASVVLGLLCLGLPFWWEMSSRWPPIALSGPAPFLALLAGAWWEAAQPVWRRRAASAAVVVHVLLGLLQPRYISLKQPGVEVWSARRGGRAVAVAQRAEQVAGARVPL